MTKKPVVTIGKFRAALRKAGAPAPRYTKGHVITWCAQSGVKVREDGAHFIVSMHISTMGLRTDKEKHAALQVMVRHAASVCGLVEVAPGRAAAPSHWSDDLVFKEAA